MKKRVLALGLSCLLAASLAAPAAAARINTGETNPICLTDHENWQVTSVDGSLSFDQLANKVKYNNITVQSFDKTLESMELGAEQFRDGIDELEDTIDDLEDLKDQLELIGAGYQQAGTMLKGTLSQLLQSLTAVPTPDENTSGEDTSTGTPSTSGTIDIDGLYKVIEGYTSAAFMNFYSQSQLESLDANIEALEEQIDTLKDQEKDYLEKTIPDTKRQFESITDQLISGAESLYMGILSLELQIEALESTLVSTNRTMQELELRYELGQIPRMTLDQVQTGLDSLAVGIDSMDTALSSMKASLQSLLGDPITGEMRLMPLPAVSAGKISAASKTRDLERAKEASYDLYTAARTVEDAQDDLDEARKDHGKKSYQYEMAEHAHEAALLQQQAAVQEFELGFLSLYNNLSPALATYTAAQGTLAYEEQVYAVEELKYSLGNISANDLADARDALETARRDCASAQMDLFTTWYNYNLAVERGIITSAASGG